MFNFVEVKTVRMIDEIHNSSYEMVRDEGDHILTRLLEIDGMSLGICSLKQLQRSVWGFGQICGGRKLRVRWIRPYWSCKKRWTCTDW